MADAGSTASAAITQLLEAWRNGEGAALDRLLPLVYGELKRLARSRLAGEHAGHTLQTTALVHEAFLRLAGSNVSWQDRVHFFAVAARAMRRVLVDHGRARRRDKRGAGALRVELADDAAQSEPRTPDLLDLDRALERLATYDPRKAQVVEMHFFGGMTYDEIAAVLQISVVTVHRDLSFARAWMFRALQDRAS